MKELAGKFLKYVGASLGVLATAYTLGWSGAWALHEIFKQEKAEARAFMQERITQSEEKFMAIHRADMSGLNGQLAILIDQNKLIISQNYRTRKIIEAKEN